MNKEDYLQSSVYCSVRHTIKAILYEKADLFLEEIMPVVEHLIEENEKLRKNHKTGQFCPILFFQLFPSCNQRIQC